MGTETITILALGAALAATMVGLLAYYRSIRVERYDMERHRAELEHLRAALESRLYELNARLVESQARWQDVNHLLLSSLRKTPELDLGSTRVRLGPFLRAAGLAEDDVKIDPKLVFVLTPFHPKHERTFATIADVVRGAGLQCLRGDEEFVRGDLLSHLLRLLVRARIVIANIEGRNPNVFYELGIAHALDKPTIMVSRGLHDIPFDMRTRKLILYESPDRLRQLLQAELTRALAEERRRGAS
jgi:DNA-binding transcriptional ArsR family regulator